MVGEYTPQRCRRHGVVVGIHGCRLCANRPVPMPPWFKDLLVQLGLRPAASADSTITEGDREHDHA